MTTHAVCMIPDIGDTTDRTLQHWLHSEGSLTKQIRELYPQARVHVELLALRPVLLSAEQSQLLSVPLRQQALEREIVLYANDIPLVYAKTHMPMTSLVGEHRRLRMLGNRVLGDYVFTHRASVRRYLWVFSSKTVKANGLVYSHVPHRASRFDLSGKPILVSEYFLPALVERIRQSVAESIDLHQRDG